VIHAELADDRLIVSTDLPSEGTLVSRVPGSRYQRKGDHWTIPATRPAVIQLKGICGDRLDCLPANVEMLAEPNSIVPLRGLDGMFPHQDAGFSFFVSQCRGILADEPGLGKTAQALASVTTPALVICPATLLQNWADEAERWVPNHPVQIISGTAAQRRKQIAAEADIYIIGYESAVKHTRLAGFGSTKLSDDERKPKELNERHWNTVIVDEAHNLANPAAKRTRAAWFLADSAERVYALTGTPVRNKPSDLWSILRLVYHDEAPVKSKWIDRYAVVRLDAGGHPVDESFEPATKDELDSIIAPRLLRRTKAEVLPGLPPKIETVRRLDMEPKQAKAYRTMKEEMLAAVEDGSFLVAPNPAQKFLRLLQIASATPLSLDEGTLELGMPSNKVNAMLDIASERSGLPTVAFSASRRLSRLVGSQLAKAGYTVGWVDGAETAAARSRAVESFQAGELDWIMCTYGAGGTGITLHASDTMVRIQRPFSKVDDIQAADRIHRIGQEAESCHYIDLTSIGTAEGRVREILNNKGELMEAVCRDKDRMVEMLEAA
jgi:SNF2 family DNA or RNA helicase